METTDPQYLSGKPSNSATLGFDLTNRTWVVNAIASNTCVLLPGFDGVFSTDVTSVSAAANDYGHIIHRTPTAVLRPASINDIIKMVSFAKEYAICIVSRGNGHTTYGQSQIDDGVVIDLKSLNHIHEITSDRAVVDAGVIWRDLLLATIAIGLTPPVLTDYTQLTIGGTLSVGGVSGRSYQFGAQVDNVLELQVVTGKGALVTCSESVNRILFDTVLAGLGLCAIIVRATIRLIPAQERARTFRMFYPDVPTMLRDMRFLTKIKSFDHLRGNSTLGGTPEKPSTDFVYFLEATSFYTAVEDLSTNSLTGLNFLPGSEQIEDRSYFEYTDLVVKQINTLDAAGLNSLPHPWLDLFVPDSKIDTFSSQAIASLDPTLLLPGSIILFFPFVRSQLTRPMLRIPSEEIFYLFDILPAVPPNSIVVEAMLANNQNLYERNSMWGGTFYTISALPMTSHDWKQYFQPVWNDLIRAKQMHDPDSVLGTSFGMFD